MSAPKYSGSVLCAVFGSIAMRLRLCMGKEWDTLRLAAEQTVGFWNAKMVNICGAFVCTVGVEYVHVLWQQNDTGKSTGWENMVLREWVREFCLIAVA